MTDILYQRRRRYDVSSNKIWDGLMIYYGIIADRNNSRYGKYPFI